MKRSILIVALVLIGVLLQRAFAQSFIAQPYYADGKVRFYAQATPINPATVAYTLDLTAGMQAAWNVTPNGSNGPNGTLIQNNKLFVSFDLGLAQGGVLVYNMLDIAAAPTAIKPGGGNGYPVAGMCINPANNDLYMATFTVNGAGGGIYYSTTASNYTGATNLSNYNDPTVDLYCANIHIDGSSNLWFTTWSGNANATEMFLVCYKGLNKNNYYKIINTATKAYTATSTGGITKTVHLLSAPEGIVRDASGNLWIGNNNDFNAVNNASEGTLVKINNAWITTLLTQAVGNSTTVPAASANVYYIPSGKLGGMARSGNTLYINDQGQAQGGSYLTNGTVWKYDVTTTFNTTNFKASGIRTTYPGNGLMTFSSALPITAAPPTKIFVKADATGLNNGTSWTNAYTDLQSALNTTTDTIFMAAGIYSPTTFPPNCVGCNSDRYKTYTITNTHKIFGNFAGTEKWLSQRLQMPYIGSGIPDNSSIYYNTILDGDVGDTNSHLDNLLRMFTILGATNCEINGLYIKEIWANIFCNTITTNNITINTGYGGGIYLHTGSSLAVNKCVFYDVHGRDLCNGTNNIMTSWGGAIYNNGATLNVNNTSISSGSAGYGGAIATTANATTNINKSYFYGNGAAQAMGGGAVYYALGANGSIKNSAFHGNSSAAVGTNGAAISTIENCLFYWNSTYDNGGAIVANDLRSAIKNCTFYKSEIVNNPNGLGAAIYDVNLNNPPNYALLVNNIFVESISSNPNNARLDIYTTNSDPNTRMRMQYNITNDTRPFTNITDLGSNLIPTTTMPQFKDNTNILGSDNAIFTADDGFIPTCIINNAVNSGTTTWNAPTTDITGSVRFGQTDIGAYETACDNAAIFSSNSSTCQTITQNTVTGNNWFHFTNALGIVCSINPQGQNLGNVTAKVADPTGTVINGVTRYLGRSVNLTSTVAPSTDYLLRIYYKDTEITEFQNATGQNGLTPNSFNVLWASGGTGCGVNNFYGTSGGVVPAQNGVATGEFGQSNEGFYLQIALNHFTLFAASTDTQNTLVGTEEVENYTNAFIYPNPTTQDIHIKINDTTNDNYTAQIFDMTGHAMTATTPLKNNETTLQMQNMPNNIYTLIIMQNNKVVMNKRVVKM